MHDRDDHGLTTRSAVIRNVPVLVSALAMTVLLPACATSASAPGERRIEVAGPTVIGYFPAVPEGELNGDAALGSALEHLEMALEASNACFGPKGVHVQTVVADQIAIVDGDHVQTILPTRDSAGIGAILVAPGRAGRIIDASRGPSSLIFYVPAAASEYFGLPACGSQEDPDAR